MAGVDSESSEDSINDMMSGDEANIDVREGIRKSAYPDEALKDKQSNSDVDSNSEEDEKKQDPHNLMTPLGN